MIRICQHITYVWIDLTTSTNIAIAHTIYLTKIHQSIDNFVRKWLQQCWYSSAPVTLNEGQDPEQNIQTAH